jgi:DNA-binding MarR family transcriptional regulator
MEKELKKEIFLKKSKLRREVYVRLDKPRTATELAKELGKHRSAISRVLLDLERAGYSKCINPEDKSFRHYIKQK